MGGVVGGVAALVVLLALLSGGGGAKKKTAPPPAPTQIDERVLEELGDDELIEAACSVASVRTNETAQQLATKTLQGLFPAFDWINLPEASIRTTLHTKTVGITSAILNGELICDTSIVIESTPRPDGFYQIKSGDTPFGIIKAAYPSLPSSQRVAAVQMVTAHPLNSGLVVAPRLASTRKMIGDQIFSMYPDWREAPTTVQQRFEPGPKLAVLYLPLLAEVS